MITVKYEEYTNDLIRRNMEKSFPSLRSFEDWFFDLCDGKYEDKISIPNPDRTDIWGDGPGRMEVNDMWTRDKCYWVHMISREGKIIFSDGKHTNYQKHWNDEMKEFCRGMLQRKNSPAFNFG